MANYNRLTPELADELRKIVGGQRLEYGEQVKEQYSHDEMPIYGKYMPEAVCLAESTEEVAAKEALRKEVSPSAFVVSRNDWIVGKINHIGGLQNGKVHLQRAERALV